MRKLFGWSVVAALVFSGVAAAQAPRPGAPVRPAAPGAAVPGTGAVAPGGQNQAMQTSDQQIAAVIAICNRHEVEMAKFALPKLKSDKAKEIATMLIKDHSEAADKFGRLAGQYATSPTRREGDEGREEGRRDNERSDAKNTETTPERAATAPNNPATRLPAAGNPAAGTARGVAQRAPGTAAPGTAAPGAAPRTALKPVAGGALNWVAIHQEVSDEGLAACKKELSKYDGNEFDKAFLGGQIAGHMKAAAELKVFRRHVSNQLASEIDNALSTTEDHLKEIKDLMEDKKDQGNK